MKFRTEFYQMFQLGEIEFNQKKKKKKKTADRLVWLGGVPDQDLAKAMVYEHQKVGMRE